MNDLSIPTRSPEALAALDIFYDEFNDVNFFVEDEDQENLYTIIFKSMFPKMRIERIFPLGGKQAVLDHSIIAVSQPGKPVPIYLVDKDFDDLLGISIQRNFLFYLDRYCIENYLLEPSALIEVIIESHPKTKRDDISAQLKLELRVQDFAEALRPLFQLFYCVRKFNLGLPNTSLPVDRFCNKSQPWIIEDDSILEYANSIKAAATNSPHSQLLQNPLEHDMVASLSSIDYHNIISGKHILMLIFRYIKNTTS